MQSRLCRCCSAKGKQEARAALLLDKAQVLDYSEIPLSFERGSNCRRRRITGGLSDVFDASAGDAVRRLPFRHFGTVNLRYAKTIMDSEKDPSNLACGYQQSLQCAPLHGLCATRHGWKKRDSECGLRAACIVINAFVFSSQTACTRRFDIFCFSLLVCLERHRTWVS
ncbi:hypothetical protein K437DRAFT_57495 [Tilletiaria anomala UBC 951]|uniref:Uncharacterized protein n=1 Tax=Tilletiaria anomala (strain ATCC 24038 / CBS 436.72 / UBC 951) TaxID=1037660 RepID=A0A066VCJ5_TILAU|nr:uncharacterized protein K437DRAFT_57495 [Tilletiaria anomala UBC 951]KDN36295.1 hypothetical protein K437DRAFT_57495 [Tilletiaria anomala UBC 951]